MRTKVSLKKSVIKVLDELSSEQLAAVLDFALFIKSKVQAEEKKTNLLTVKTGSFADLKPLVGIFDLGGDAIVDCENYWE